jgi:hypothetical protein
MRGIRVTGVSPVRVENGSGGTSVPRVGRTDIPVCPCVYDSEGIKRMQVSSFVFELMRQCRTQGLHTTGRFLME